MKNEWAPIELWAWKQIENERDNSVREEDGMREWLSSHWFEYPALGLDESQYKTEWTFSCLDSECESVLAVSMMGKENARIEARIIYGWSVGSDDFGSNSICPKHRDQWGR